MAKQPDSDIAVQAHSSTFCPFEHCGLSMCSRGFQDLLMVREDGLTLSTKNNEHNRTQQYDKYKVCVIILLIIKLLIYVTVTY
jgi:hypothetical protein